MGLIGGAATILGVASKVVGTVFSLGSSALSLGGKFIKSWPGKLAIGMVAGSILGSKVTGGENLFTKISEGFKGFLGSAKDSVKEASLKVATTALNAGEKLSETRTNLENMIASDAERGAPAEPQNDNNIQTAQAQAPVQEAPAASEPAYGP